MLVTFANNVKEAALFAANKAATVVDSSARYCGRKFEDLTEAALPVTAAKIVQKLVYSSPFTVAALFAPAYMQLAALASYTIVHIVHDIAGNKGELPFNQTAYERGFTGVGVAFLYKAAQETVKVATQQKASIVSLVVNLALASFFVSRAIHTPSPTFGGSTPTTAGGVAAPKQV